MRLSPHVTLPLVLAGAPALVLAQRPLTQNNADCVGAVFIPDSVHVCDQAVRGFGNILEIKENPSDIKEWFEREHNTTWYTFRAPVKTKLSMDIIPKNIEDDIDFLIFEGAIPGICDKVQQRAVVPIRSNISRNDKSNNSICGLRKDATEDHVRSGVGSSFSRAIEVEEGELLYLVIDYQDRPLDGYTIRFHYDPPPPPPVPEKNTLTQQLMIDITDARTGKPIEATLTIEGMFFDRVVEAKGKSSYAFNMEPYRNLKLGCIREGYMFYSAKQKGTMDPEVRMEVKLVPISPGEHVVLEDIRFVGNDTKVMRNSEGPMLLLLRFMQANPKVRVEIQGHVNGPTYKNTKEFIELSTGRARTVYDFLLVNDVDPARISYVGLGNSQMLFPEPKNKEQSEANRRVEVKVISN
ncbi:MAG: OmpA family protein [Flavobacteriales bacterium]|nr:OmpA family protein [Flavobacteriales bacterium]